MSSSTTSSYIAQAFLNFSRHKGARAESSQKRQQTAGILGSMVFSEASSMSQSNAFGMDNGTLESRPQSAQINGGHVITSPQHPLLLRLNDSCTAESATIQALQHYYASRWSEKLTTILAQLAEDHNIRPSEQLSVELGNVARTIGGRAAVAAAADNSLNTSAGRQRRLSSVDQKKERTADEIIRAVVKHEERCFYEEVLPSRFLEDYQICVALADGSLPNPRSQGAVTTGKPYQEQLKDASENPKQWLIPAGTIVKQHPKATFPYNVTIFYKPTKTSRTMNDIMARSSSFVVPQNPYGLTSDANVSNFVSAVANSGVGGATTISPERGGGVGASGSPLKSAVQQILHQTAPKNMLDDEAARRRGFTILPFLPKLVNGEQVDPHVVKLLRKASASIPALGGRSTAGGAAGAAADALQDDDDRDKDIDVTVDELLKESGLTLYDVARHGNGQMATMGKEFVLETIPALNRSDVERRRQENIIRAERAQEQREATALRLAEKKELSMREEHTIKMSEQRILASKTALDLTREKSMQDVSKENRRLSLQRQVEEYKRQAETEIQAADARQTAFMDSLEMTLREKVFRRQLDTTLEGERTKAEQLSRRAGPLSLRLNEFRPKVKALDQEQRQEQALQQLVGKLDDVAQQSQNSFYESTAAALRDRDAYQRVVQDEKVVRTADAGTLEKKEVVRTSRVENRTLQETLLRRAPAEIPILEIAKKPSTAYFAGSVEEERLRAQEYEKNFLEWKENRKIGREAAFCRKELGYHTQ